MFKDKDKNKIMLEGAYKKFKTYYYYNKSFVSMKKKIAEFEYDRMDMNDQFNNMAEYLHKPSSKKSKKYIEELMNQIDFSVLPKKFEASNTDIKTNVLSNTMPKDKKLKTVNFFVEIPIQLHILDSLWTLFLGKMTMKHEILSFDCYGNTLAEKVLYNESSDDFSSIRFENSKMFNIYYYKYTDWRNNAFESMEKNYDENKHSVLLSLDIKSYYYSVEFDFSMLKNIFGNDPLVKKINHLSNLMQQIYKKYHEIVSNYKNDIKMFQEGKNILPIGLFSSMILGNIYLADFDKRVKKCLDVSYYGRYVDDMLFVFRYDILENKNINDIINKTLINNNLFTKDKRDYVVKGLENLKIQEEKIQAVHIDPCESKTIIDTYNKTIKIHPSQQNVLPDYALNLSDVDESIYSIENFTRENKIRDIGQMEIKSYKVSRYFSTLLLKSKNMNQQDTDFTKTLDSQIDKITKFFSGSQSLEFYANWMNYMYFLVICGKKKELDQFYTCMKSTIQEIEYKSIDKEVFKKRSQISKKVKATLISHLKICMASALSIDRIKNTGKITELTKKLQVANMFNHNLISIPLINYLEFDGNVSYKNMKVNEVKCSPDNINNSFSQNAFKIKWSPRFIRFEELIEFLFVCTHNTGENYNLNVWINKYYEINNINWRPFEIEKESLLCGDKHKLERFEIHNENKDWPRKVRIAVGSIKITASECLKAIKEPMYGLNTTKKENLNRILKEAYVDEVKKVNILVLPELFVSIYWLQDIIDFSKKSQIAIIVGLQYMSGNDGSVHNYIATILPFRNSYYKNAFVHVREKNDYSPIEKENLLGTCKDSEIATYQIFNWENIDIGTSLCYEFTDIMARALFKGNADVIAVPVFNPDTTYFSNIVDSATRDLHTIIAQANTSIYGDSRITCPYDRDSKDVVKIKGGDIDHIIVGTVNLGDIIRYQAVYGADKLKKPGAKTGKSLKVNKKAKPEIKKLSARFDTRRAENKLRGSRFVFIK